MCSSHDGYSFLILEDIRNAWHLHVLRKSDNERQESRRIETFAMTICCLSSSSFCTFCRCFTSALVQFQDSILVLYPLRLAYSMINYFMFSCLTCTRKLNDHVSHLMKSERLTWWKSLPWPLGISMFMFSHNNIHMWFSFKAVR